MTNDEFSTYVEIAKPFVEPIISTILKPKIIKISNWLKKQSIENSVVDNYFENKFTDYLTRAHRNSSIINTLVFPNQQVKIKDIYFPLGIVSTKNREKSIIDDKFVENLFKISKRILISDTAGMGKSTLMKWITLNLIETPSTIPILIELRKIDSDHKIIDEIFQLIDPIDKSFDKDLIIKFLELGFFTIILDGFDEIPKEFQESVTIELKNFISKVPENNFILTSRPESALSSFGDFQLFYIDPLKPKESYEIIKNYDKLNNEKFADKLILEIKTRNEQVKEFLTNPFLVSLLYKSYTFNKDIPSKKTTFYEEVYTSLFKHHDSSKDGYKRQKNSNLDILDFRIILRYLAFETSKLGKVTYTEPELLKFISNSKDKSVNINFKEVNYLEDLLTTVPIFVKDGNQIKWAHKSIQDYFAAEYITYDSRKAEILNKIYTSEKDNYLNIIDLIYELEPKIFRKVIYQPLLNQFITEYENTYKNCLGIDQNLVNERKSKVFGITFCVINCNKYSEFGFVSELFKKELDGNLKDKDIGGTHLVSEKIFILNTGIFKSQIIDILYHKNEDIFAKFKTNYIERFINIKKLKYNTPYIINDNPESPINSPKLFIEINELLTNRPSRRNNSSQYLDYEKSKKILYKLNKEIEFENSNSDLDDI